MNKEKKKSQTEDDDDDDNNDAIFNWRIQNNISYL